MSDAETKPPHGENEDELQQALMAAFGDNAMSMMEDDDDDEIPAEILAAFGAEIQQDSSASLETNDSDAESAATAIANQLESFAGTQLRDDDSPRTQWIKNLSSAIYTDHRKSKEKESDQSGRFVVFAIADMRFGVRLSDVREIARYPKVTPLPCTPPWLRGVANFRGQILSVTDLRNLIGDSSQRPTVGEKVIVVQCPRLSASTALVVDRVIGIRSIAGQPINDSPLSPDIKKIASRSAMMDQVSTVLIDVHQLLGFAELNAFTQSQT